MRSAAHRPEPPAYRRAGEMARAEMEARLIDRLGDYHVHVTAIGAAEDIAAVVAARLGVLGLYRVKNHT